MSPAPPVPASKPFMTPYGPVTPGMRPPWMSGISAMRPVPPPISNAAPNTVPSAKNAVSGPNSGILKPVPGPNNVILNFENANLLDVIHTVFGSILNVNYMVDPHVRGKVTIRTQKPVSRDNVLKLMKMILHMSGAGVVKENGLYKIVPVNEVPSATPRIYVYPLQNSKADHVAKILQSIFSGTAASGGGRPAPMGPMGGPTGHTGKKPLVSSSTQIFADKITNSLVVLATPKDYKFIKATIKKLDTRPRQVMIDVLVAEVTLTHEFQFGLEWVLANNLHLTNRINLNGQAGQNSDQLPGGVANAASAIFAPLQGFSYAAVDAAGRVKGLLQALASKDNLKVLASPHILCADNRKAKIQIGENIPIATSQATNVGTAVTPGATSILSTIQYQETGTILTVKPRINESGLVALDIDQEVSAATPQTILGQQQFVISERKVNTHLVAQDGQTIVLGGLISQNISKSRVGIPILDDIPILGYLFGSWSDNTTRSEIVVLLTPHVIENTKQAGRVTKRYIRKLEGMNGEFKKVIPAAGIPGLDGKKQEKTKTSSSAR